jgi:hypothetical protein
MKWCADVWACWKMHEVCLSINVQVYARTLLGKSYDQLRPMDSLECLCTSAVLLYMSFMFMHVHAAVLGRCSCLAGSETRHGARYI